MTLIDRVEEAEALECVGAFVDGVRDAITSVLPHLDHATPEQVSTLYELAHAIQGTCALNMAQIKRRDAIAAKQNEEHERLSEESTEEIH